MINRLEVNKELFKERFDYILEYLNLINRNEYQKNVHIIVPGLEREFYKTLSSSKNFNPYINIYNDYLDLKENNVCHDSDKYLINPHLELPSETIDRYYAQSIAGWSPTNLNKNFIVVLCDNGDLRYKHNNSFIGNARKDMFIEAKLNLMFGLNGKCTNCLNCMCDLTKSKSFIVDESECIKSKALYDLVSKEVKEVTHEQYIKLAEGMNEIVKSNNYDHAVILTELSKGGEDNEQNKK